jgi:hypothetical protein
MKMRFYWPFLAGFVFVTTPFIAANYAHADPPVHSSVTNVGISALASSSPPLGTTMPPSIGGRTSTTIPFEAGPRETLAQCMAYWDAGTHMSIAEWYRACQRTQDGTIF